MEHIVKRKGKRERFDAKKIYGSAYAACLNCHLSEKECERTADKISKSVKKWVSSRKMVSSEQIFKQVVKELKKYNRDAAFMYETHRDIS